MWVMGKSFHVDILLMNFEKKNDINLVIGLRDQIIKKKTMESTAQNIAH